MNEWEICNMTAVIVQYPLDPSGTNPNNLVTGEIHTMVKRKVRAVAATYGAFFADTLKVYDQATQRLLTKDVDYYAAEQYELPSARYGKSICGVVMILDQTVGDQVSLTYQALGGDFSTPATQTVTVLEHFNLDNRNAAWAPIVPKPSDDQSGLLAFSGTGPYTFEYLAIAIDRLARAMQYGDEVAHDALIQYIEAHRGKVTPDLLMQIQLELQNSLAAHIAATDPHPQYFKKTDEFSVAPVKQPTNLSPVGGASDVSQLTSFTASPYRGLYQLAQAAAQFQVSQTKDFSGTIDIDATVAGSNVTTYNQTVLKLAPTTLYYWRVRYKNSEGTWSAWSEPTGFVTGVLGVAQPVITSPLSGTTLTTSTPTLTSSAFKVQGTTDTHASSDWEVWTGPDGSGTKLWGVYGDTVNKTNITVPAGKLPTNQNVYPRVRHNASGLGASPWSYSSAYFMNYPLYPSTIGEAWGGGVYAGTVTIGSGANAGNWGIIVAPAATGELTNTAIGTASGTNSSPELKDSVTNTNNLKTMGSAAATTIKNLTIGGFTDWTIPASDVLATIMANNAQLPAANKLSAAVYLSSSYYTTVSTVTVQDPDTPIYGTGVTYSYGQHTMTGYYSENGDLVPQVSCAQGQILWEGNTVYPATNPRTGKSDSYQQVVWECVEYGQVIVGWEPGGSHQETTTSYSVNCRTLNSNGTTTPGSVSRTYNTGRIRAVRLIQLP
jgi:hypothetical protein